MNHSHLKRCPKCHKKWRRCRCNAPIVPKKLVINFLLFCAVVAITAVAYPWCRSFFEDRGKKEAGALRNTIDAYSASKTQTNDWWLLDSRISPKALAKTSDDVRNYVADIIARCKDVSPLAKRIAERFPTFMPTVWENGISRLVHVTKEGEAPPAVPQLGQEICFFSREDDRRFQFPGRMYWKKEWQAMMVGGMKWPTPVLGGLVYHELGHGLKDVVDHAPSASAHHESDLYIEEEVEMHELQALVVDRLTGGRYLARIDGIVQAHRNAKSASAFLAAVTVDELRSLDVIVGADTGGQDISQTVLAQYLTDLGLRFLGGESAPLTEKIKFYRWIRKAAQ